MKKVWMFAFSLALIFCLAACGKCDHDFVVKSRTLPTCTAEGSIEYECASCGEKKSEAIEQIAHTFDAGKVTKEASCTAEGVKTNTCTGCGETKTFTIAKTAHSYDGGKVTKAATCTAEGTKTYTCTGCGETKTETVAKLAHSYDGGKVTKAATCTAEGTKTYTCTGCGETKTETIAKKAHSYDGGKVTKKATCTAEGSKTYTCTGCGATKTESISKTAHSYDGGKVTKAATCTAEGTKTYTCNSCGKTKTESIEKKAHNYAGATCKTAAKCTVCGKTSGSASKHSYVDGYCKWCNTKDPNYVKVYSVGEKWKVANKFEITIDSVVAHKVCSGNYDEMDTDVAVIIKYTYKNLGSDKLCVDKWDFEVYDAKGAEGENRSFPIWCDHGEEAKNCISGGSFTAKLPVALQNDGDFVTIMIDKDGYTATFKAKVTEAPAEEDPEEDLLDGCTITCDTALPTTLSYYKYNGTKESSCSVTDVSFEVSGDDLYIYFTGRKTYDSRGSGQSDSCKISWKLYDSNNNVIEAGTTYTLSLATGEGFVKTKDTAYNCITPGETYYIVLLNTN